MTNVILNKKSSQQNCKDFYIVLNTDYTGSAYKSNSVASVTFKFTKSPVFK